MGQSSSNDYLGYSDNETRKKLGKHYDHPTTTEYDSEPDIIDRDYRKPPRPVEHDDLLCCTFANLNWNRRCDCDEADLQPVKRTILMNYTQHDVCYFDWNVFCKRHSGNYRITVVKQMRSGFYYTKQTSTIEDDDIAILICYTDEAYFHAKKIICVIPEIKGFKPVTTFCHLKTHYKLEIDCMYGPYLSKDANFGGKKIAVVCVKNGIVYEKTKLHDKCDNCIYVYAFDTKKELMNAKVADADADDGVIVE